MMYKIKKISVSFVKAGWNVYEMSICLITDNERMG